MDTDADEPPDACRCLYSISLPADTGEVCGAGGRHGHAEVASGAETETALQYDGKCVEGLPFGKSRQEEWFCTLGFHQIDGKQAVYIILPDAGKCCGLP